MNELRCLVEQARAGDLEAFTEVVRRFQDMAHGYAYSILGDFHLAEDAAQEAFVDAYYKLDSLREPAAFPGWFRRIVFKHCDRIIQKKRVPAVPLAEGMRVAESDLQRSEMQERVLEAIRELPERQRETTTLYYINGYSQNEISDFLEVPVTTIKKRLHDSRKKLKERMLGMVEDTLKNNAPDERFSRKVIDELRARPNLLKLSDHPVAKTLEAIMQALAEYEYVEGDEVIARTDPRNVYTIDVPKEAYPVDDDHVLRTSTTPIVERAAVGRTPPVHLITAGRAFRSGDVDGHPHRANVFHMVDVLCIAPGVTVDDLRRTLKLAVAAGLGEQITRWEFEEAAFAGYVDCLHARIQNKGRFRQVAGAGMISPASLSSAGFDPTSVSGFAYGIGLERLTMLRLGLDDIKALWKPPYVR